MTDTPTPTTSVQDNEISLLDLLQTIVDNLRLLVLGPLLVGLAALGITFAVPPTFTAETKFLPPQQQQSMAASMLASLGALGGLAGAATGLKNPADQYVAFLKSNSIEDALIERFKLMERYDVKYKTKARKTLEENVKIASGKDGLITVKVDDIDPQIAADMANAYVQELTKLLSRLAVTEAQQRRQFFEKQLQQTKEKLTQAEIALKETGISSNVLKANPQSAVAAVASLQAQVTVQEVKLGAMRGYLAESAPDFKQALTELATLRAQLAKQSQDISASNKEGRAKDDYITKYRDYKYQETLFELFAKQFEMAKVDESREGSIIQVLDVADPPEIKTKPKTAMIVITLTLISCFLLFIILITGKILRRNNRNIESAKKINTIKKSLQKSLGLI